MTDRICIIVGGILKARSLILSGSAGVNQNAFSVQSCSIQQQRPKRYMKSISRLKTQCEKRIIISMIKRGFEDETICFANINNIDGSGFNSYRFF